MIIRLFSVIGEHLGEEKFGAGRSTGPVTPREAKSEVNRIMEDKTHPDNEAYRQKRHPRNKEVVKKVQRLLAKTG